MSDLTPEQPPQPTPGGGMAGAPPTSGIRMVLIVLGAAGMLAAPLVAWVGDPSISWTGIELGMDVFWSADPTIQPGFFASAGLAAVVIGLIALIGLAPGARWFSVVGGVLGVAAAVLVAVSALRAGFGFEHLRLGLYLLFVGGLLALIGGLLPAAPAVEAPQGEAPPAEPPRRPPAEPPPPA